MSRKIKLAPRLGELRVKAFGYEPSPTDLDLTRKEREARAVNRIELDKQEAHGKGDGANGASPSAEKLSTRGNGGRKAVLAAIDAVLVANRVPVPRREAVLAAAAEQLAMRLRQGQKSEVKLYDKAAPSRRPAAVPTPDVQRTRERTSPAPAR